METQISGYASLFWTRDLNDDVTAAGAFSASLARTGAGGVKMLCQHDADRPVGVWDEVVEDGRGLFVRGRIFDVTPEGRLCAALVRAGAMDGLSIGFKAVKARPDDSGRLRVLTQVELWEVSVVTFPMLPGARISTVISLPLEGGGAGVGVAA
jgi:HK97 family phage prohead protease